MSDTNLSFGSELASGRHNGVDVDPATNTAVATAESEVRVFDTTDWTQTGYYNLDWFGSSFASSAEPSVALDPDGQYFAATVWDHSSTTVSIFSTDGNELSNGATEWFYFSSDGYGVSFSPSGNRLAVGIDSEVVVLDTSDPDPANWSEEGRISHGNDNVRALDFANTSDQLVVSSYGGDVSIYDMSGGPADWSVTETLASGEGWSGVSFSEDDTWIGVGSWDNNVHVYEDDGTGSWSNVYSDTNLGASIYAIEFDVQNDWLLYGQGYDSNTMYLADAASWTVESQIDTSDNIESIAFANDSAEALTATRSAVETYNIGAVTATISASAASSTADGHTPTIDSRKPTTVTTDPSSATSTAQTPAVTSRITASATADPTTATTATPPPAVDSYLMADVAHGYGESYTDDYGGARTVTVTTDTATATASAPAPAIGTGNDIIVDSTTATTAAPPPTTFTQLSPTVTPDPPTATTTASSPTIDSRRPATVTAPTADATATGSDAAITTTKWPTITVDATTATETAPTPTVYMVHDNTVAVTATSASTDAPAPLFTLGARATIDPATASTTADAPHVVGEMDTAVVVDPTGAATTAAPSPSLTALVNSYNTPSTATADVVTGFAAPNPEKVTVGPDTATATAVAIESSTLRDPSGWGDGAWGEGDWGGTGGETEELRVEARYPASVLVEETTASADGTAPSHVEAVAPITSLPAAIEGQTPTAETEATVSPYVYLPGSSVEPRKPDNKHYRESVTEEKPEFAEAQQRAFSTEESSVYTPERHLYINDEEITVDREIFISAGENGAPIADITLYNLDPATWTQITERDEVTIELGWRQGDSQRVFDGRVAIKRRRPRQHNRGYVLRAVEIGGARTNRTLTRTFNKMSPHRIVEHLALDLEGIRPGYIATGTDRLESAYTLSSSMALRGWLDRLAEKATKQTGTQWVWYTEGDKLSFHPIDEQVTDHIELGLEKSISGITPVGVAQTDPSRHTYEVVMRCEPVLERGVAVTIADSQQINDHELYRIAEYTHTSKTTTGRHHTTAVIAPLRKEIERPF